MKGEEHQDRDRYDRELAERLARLLVAEFRRRGAKSEPPTIQQSEDLQPPAA